MDAIRFIAHSRDTFECSTCLHSRLCYQFYFSSVGQQETQLVEDDQPVNFINLQRVVISTESDTPAPDNNTFCIYCRNAPCVLLSGTLPSKLQAYGQPRMTNHVKRKSNYKAFYTILKHKGLWRDPVYLQRKEALGCYIEDVREVMPICVVEDVRKRWPNPDGVPYCGHRRS